MTIQDMLLDDQIDADLIVDKLQHVKVKYLSPNVNNWEVNKLKKQHNFKVNKQTLRENAIDLILNKNN